MKKSIKSLLLLMTVVVLCFAVNLSAFASNETNDGNIKIEVATNKGSYSATGVAEITATITNVSSEDINNIIAQAVFDDLAPAGKRKSETSKSVDVLKSGESFSFTYKATLNKDEHKLNIFQKIILWFIRLFNGGYNANNNNIDVVTECVTGIDFGKFTAENVIQVGYLNTNDSSYDKLVQGVDIDEVYEHNEENLSVDSGSGIQYTNNIIMIMFDWECTNKRKAEIVNSINGKVVGGVEGYNELHVEIKNSTLEEIENICDELNKNEDIYATYDSITTSISKIPNDLYQLVDTESETEFDFLRNWDNAFDAQSYTWSAVAIEAPGAWDYNDYFSTIKIGVVDSGFSTTNRDLELRIVSSENSPENHGTNVAGVIGATANNKTGLAGVVWNKNLLAYDAWISGNSGMYDSDIFAGIEKLVKSGCKVINLSLGKEGILNDKNIKKEGKSASKKMAQLLEAGYDFIIVQAAGNGDANQIGIDAINNGTFCSVTEENCYSSKKVSVNDIMDRIIIVANATRNVDGDNNSYFLAESSNRGAQVDIAAPGSNVLTTTNLTDFPYSLESGTSIAAPFVTGVASLVWSANTHLTGKEVREIVLSTAEEGNVIVYENPSLPTTGDFYMVNAKLAVKEAIRRTNTSSGGDSGNTDTGTTTITGTVKDWTTGTAISGAVIDVSKQGDNFEDIIQTATTNEYGEFSLALPLGNYQLYYSATGYKKLGEFVDIDDISKNIDLGTIYLEADSSSGGEDDITIIASGNCGVNGDNVKWTLYDDGELVISGSGAMDDYSNAPWNSYRSSIIKVTIKNGVTNIGDYAFNSCNNLTSITISDSVTAIGGNAFRYCQRLSNVTIPDSVTSIGSYAFDSCCSLTSITIPNSVTSIGDRAFYQCDNLTSITVPENITHIGWDAFEDTMYYENDLNWENGVLYIGCHLIAAKPSLMGNYEIKPGTKTIAVRAFYECEKLEGITIPNSIKKIEPFVFYGCTNLIIVNLPESLLSIGQHAFQYCVSIESIIIPDSVVYIDFDAFANCENIKNITIPASAEIWSASAFNGCKSIKNIVITKGNGIMVSPCKVWHASENKDLNITLEEGITNIRASAFSGCTGLKSIVIPKSVKKIEVNAFLNCVNLAKLTIPASTEIRSSAFRGCTAITDILISNGTGSMISYTKDTYECTPWYIARNNELNITLENGISNIGSYAFYFCKGISNIVIPNSVTLIEKYAFCSCSGLTSVDLSNSVISIGDNAFAWCQKLTNITIPDSVTIIGNHAFSSSALLSLKIGKGVANIGDSAFLCTDITDVYYCGTEEEWNFIVIGTNNEYLTNATIHCNS